MSIAGATLIPSTSRPIPLEVRADLVFQHVACGGKGYWVVKDPVSLSYFQLYPEQLYLLQMIDGRRNLEQFREELLVEFPYTRPTLADIQAAIVDLHSKRLVRGSRPGQGVALFESGRKQKRQKLWAALKNILYLQLPGWDPERTLKVLYPFVSWMFHPLAVTLTVAFVAAAWTLLAVQFGMFTQRLPEFKQFFGWPNLVYLWLTLGATKIIHELGHAIACRHYGGECHQIGVIFLVFSPTLYCDVSDSWMLSNKWQRIIIGGAGMYIESVISSLALFGWWFTQPGLLNHLLLNVFFVSAVTTVLFNLNPLMRYDGYYMLSDLLEIPNLSRKAQRLAQETFGWYCLGIRPHPDPFMPTEGRFWFVVYAVASVIYRWVVLFGIAMFLYVVLKPYELQSIGIALACVSVVGIVVSLVQNVVALVRAPRPDPVSRPKMAATGLIASAAVLGALMLPFPWHLEGSFVIEPRNVHHVYAAVPGELVKVSVQPGQRVEVDAELMVLDDVEKRIRYQELRTELEVAQSDLTTQLGVNNFPGASLARERISMLEKQVADYAEQLQQLTILAKVAGVVVAAPRVAEPKLVQPRVELAGWYGTLLDRGNLGCLLKAGEHVASIAPDGLYQAVLLIDQGDRADLAEGQNLEIKFDHLPTRSYQGVIREISQRHIEFAPESLSNKQGGELPTVTDKRGRERLTSHAYQALVELDEDAKLLKSGLRGRVRFRVGHRSAAQWLWRAIRRTFHFRM